ncbi:MAG: NHLP bacteriocin system secretion protein [Thiohalomonadaceae bacterium]|jgi:HlyD family secretion protein
MNPLFRQQALAKVTNPDQLDQTLRVVRPRHVLGFLLILLIMLAGLIWSVLSTAPIKASGPGVLLSSSGVAAITAQDTGHVDQLLVKAGDQVVVGQIVARIRHPERKDGMLAAIEEAHALENQHRTLQAEISIQDRMQAELIEQMRQAQKDRLISLEEQRQALAQRRESEATLRAKGIITAVNLFETEAQLAQVSNEIAITKNRLFELSLTLEQEASRRHQELTSLRLNVENASRRADNLRSGYERDRLAVADSAGTVAELAVDVNDPVVAGQVIARLLADNVGENGLTAIAYLPASEGKKIKEGMPALVTPSTVKVELEGYVRGQVVRVSELPATREGLMRRLKNAAQVEEIFKAGAPFEVEIKLQLDSSTTSGYAWTSGKGPDLQLEPGTLARTEVVVGRVHIISLVFPAMDHVLGWFKAL